MTYLEAYRQTVRMGGYCRFCGARIDQPGIAKRLSVKSPWAADTRFRRAFARTVAARAQSALGRPRRA